MLLQESEELIIKLWHHNLAHHNLAHNANIILMFKRINKSKCKKVKRSFKQNIIYYAGKNNRAFERSHWIYPSASFAMNLTAATNILLQNNHI